MTIGEHFEDNFDTDMTNELQKLKEQGLPITVYYAEVDNLVYRALKFHGMQDFAEEFRYKCYKCYD